MSQNIDTNFIQQTEQEKPKRKAVTNKLRWIPIILFIVSFFFKWMHWPFAGLGMVISCGLFVLLSIGQTIEFIRRKELGGLWMNLTLNFSLLYLLFRFMYWKLAIFLFVLACVFAMIYMLAMFRKNEGVKFRNAMVMICLGLAITVQQMPNHSLFYHLNLSETFNQWERDNVVYAWDRYSWLLYVDEEIDQALSANKKAFEVNEKLRTEYHGSMGDLEGLLEMHRAKISNRNWHHYDFLFLE